ncbi:hypothetical protein [Aestuariivirga sp.]|uniref:hypothetical protein n=1 Tax=Aestuariivirga sp. TaxID=2650926 RepID=UPI00359448FE
MMVLRIVLLCLSALALTGCVLQSGTPLYDDTSSVLALGTRGGAAKLASRIEGKWVPEKEAITIKVVGKHYEVTSGTSTVALNFVKLKGSTYVVQGRESGKAAAYMLGNVTNGIAEVRPIACTDIKAEASLAKWVEHDKDDCFVKPGPPPEKLFTAISKLGGEATSRIEIAAQ